MNAVAHRTAWLAGYIPDLPTPFDAAGAIDMAALQRLCERQIEAGAPAIVVCETTGESSTLTPAEQAGVIRAAVRIAGGRVRVIAGAGSNSTSQAIELTRQAEAEGADAALSVVPYYNKPMQAGIAAHFTAIAGATALPIILHDIPARTNRELSDATLAGLAQSPRFIGLRDGSGDVARVARLRSLLPADFRLMAGDDSTALACVASGADGCISLTSNVAPKLCRAVLSSYGRGLLQAARDLQDKLAPLTAALSRESPAALKYALCLLGLMSPDTRLPIVELDDAAKAEVANAIAAIGDEEIACPIESRPDRRFHRDHAAISWQRLE
jgi:4-hydroxy-tetrahydrodipicolinate synthase